MHKPKLCSVVQNDMGTAEFLLIQQINILCLIDCSFDFDFLTNILVQCFVHALRSSFNLNDGKQSTVTFLPGIYTKVAVEE